MFTLTTNLAFTHAVSVNVPSNGGFRVETFKATFRVLSVDEVAQFAPSSSADTRKFLQAAIITLDDLVDDAGVAIPYSDSLRDQVIDLPFARLALIHTYIEAVTKTRVARNSSR
ncbi:MAG: hypothetical protein WDM94_09730 [Bauldia sp.]